MEHELEHDHEWLLRRLRERQFAEAPIEEPVLPLAVPGPQPVSQSNVQVYAEGGPPERGEP